MRSAIIYGCHVAGLLSLSLLACPLAIAHSPHDLITDVESAPLGAAASHTYILNTDQVFRSDEQGAAWKLLERGLNNQYSFTSVVVSPTYAEDGTLFVHWVVVRTLDPEEAGRDIVGRFEWFIDRILE